MLRKTGIVALGLAALLVLLELESGYVLYHKEHRRLAIPHAASEVFHSLFAGKKLARPWRLAHGHVVWGERDRNPFIQDGKLRTYQFHPLIDFTGAFTWDIIDGRLDYFGFRNERDYYFESSSAPLVVLTGGSEVAGGHHPVTIAQHLEQILSERLGTPWRVLNLGMHSYTLSNEMNAFVQLGYSLGPRYLISHSGWNDVLYGLMVPHPFQRAGLSYYKYVESWFERLYQLSLAPIDTAWTVDPRNEQLIVGNYFRNIDKYRAIANAAGAEFIVGLQPYNRLHRENSDIDSVYEIVHRLHDQIAIEGKTLVQFPNSLGIQFVDSIHSDWPGARKVAEQYAKLIVSKEQRLARR